MSWDYRIIREEETLPNGEKAVHFSIGEIYQREDNGLIWGFTTDEEPYGEDVDELRENLEQMMESFDKPVVDAALMPESEQDFFMPSDEDVKRMVGMTDDETDKEFERLQQKFEDSKDK